MGPGLPILGKARAITMATLTVRHPATVRTVETSQHREKREDNHNQHMQTTSRGADSKCIETESEVRDYTLQVAFFIVFLLYCFIYWNHYVRGLDGDYY